MSHLSVTSINTRGLVDLVKCSSVFSFLHSEGHDIALLQECNIPYKSNYRPFQDRWMVILYGQVTIRISRLG